MLIGMRNAMMAGGGLSAKSYVQDGLVAMWDGIENAGWGQSHDIIANGWVDCVGRLTFNMSGFTIDGDGGIVVNQPVYCDWSGPLPDVDNVCVQMVARGKAPHVDSTADCGGYFCGVGMLIDRESSTYRSGRITTNLNPGGRNYAYTIDVAKFGVYNTWSAVLDGAIKCFCNSDAVNVSQSSFYNNSAAIPHQVYFGASSSKPLFIRSFRIYSRALTAAEIAANYAVDVARFTLPDAT